MKVEVVQPEKALEHGQKAELLTREDLEGVVREQVAEHLKALNGGVKLTMDEFLAMLKTLISEYSQTKEELNRVKKSAEEWRRRAGKYLEQAQQALQRRD